MTLPPLTIVPAGAGSGKTYTIEQRLGRWLVDGAIAPDRIVAVTFTQAAASELRERIRARLLGLGRLEDALALDQSFISTIHGFGLRLLGEFAFEAGLSPMPRLLSEDEETTLVGLALARTAKANAITSDLRRYGYRYDFGTGKTAEATFRDDLLAVVSLLRSLGWKENGRTVADQAVEWIRRRYGDTGDGEVLGAALRACVERLLAAFPGSLAREYGTSKAAREDLQKDYRHLRDALQDADALASDWALWQGLRTLRRSKRRAPLPGAYDELATGVIAAADALPSHPGPLAQAASHIEALLGAGQDVLVAYATAKRAAGLVDYGDMIAMAFELLRDNPLVLQTLRRRVDCLVIDEFQDTNPLQFALLWQLHSAGVPALIVGDLKQAIMGFQDADPRLLEALERQNAGALEPLANNWRSQPALMAFINAVGSKLFGKSYVALAARGADSALDALEVITFADKGRKDWHRVRAVFLGRRLRALIDDPRQRVVDRRSGERRGLCGGDVAVLCPTHAMLDEYAGALRALGLRVRIEEVGWRESRAVRIACHALAWVANPADRHAALCLAATELGSLSLEAALGQLMDAGTLREPLLDRLEGLAAAAADRSVYALVADTIAVLGLYDAVSVWPDGAQQRANLLRLQAEAGEFMDANREALAHGGFHGAGVQTFLAWLEAKTIDKDEQPDAQVIDEEAIDLVTWHSAKGREWPLVAVCGMDRPIKATLPALGLGYDTFDELPRLLDHARIEYAPRFSAPETNERFLAERRAEAETESRRLLYVAITRAREKLLLEWPSYLAGKDSLTPWSLLSVDAGLSLRGSTLHVGEATYSCVVSEGGAALPADFDPDATAPAPLLPAIGRRAIRRRSPPRDLTPDSVTPSTLAGTAPVEPEAHLSVARYGAGLASAIGLSGTELGTFLHRCFEVIGTDPSLAGRLPAIAGIAVEEKEMRRIADAVAQFEQWLAGRFNPASVERELAVLALDGNSSVLSGTADLVVRTAGGVWIVDHKSDRIEDPASAFATYRPQLLAYTHALGAGGEPVCGIAINWIRRGEVFMERIDGVGPWQHC